MGLLWHPVAGISIGLSSGTSELSNCQNYTPILRQVLGRWPFRAIVSVSAPPSEALRPVHDNGRIGASTGGFWRRSIASLGGVFGLLPAYVIVIITIRCRFCASDICPFF